MSINPINSANIPNSSNASRVDSAGIKRGRSENSEAANSASPNEQLQGNGAQNATNPIAELPEVREEVIQQAINRLESGYYGSREAAVQTAKAILGK